MEINVTSEEALQLLVQTHGRFEGLNDFVRIELALDLEPYFQEKAKLNQRAGGKGKGLSKLTVAGQVDSRGEIARVAGVSPGNVRKVKRIVAEACSEVREAARTRELSINCAEKWSHLTHAQQLELLRQLRIERTLRTAVRQIVAKQMAAVSPSGTKESVLDIESLARLTDQMAM